MNKPVVGFHRNQRMIDVLPAIGIFILTLLIFWWSPVHQVTDSQYSMLLSEGLIRHRSFALDHFQIPRLQPVQRSEYVMNGGMYQLELVGNRIYYFFPPGSSILSIPYVAIANALGVSATNSDGSFNERGELTIETGLAAFLMALLATIFYFSARLILPVSWSVVVALGASLGTQIWSTASRGLWSHTWSVFLTALVVYLLLRAEIAKESVRPVLLATLLSWMYFVRPSNSIQIICITVFLAVGYRKKVIPFAVAGTAWLLVFVAYSRHNFGTFLPNYYRASRADVTILPEAFPGNLISPSRGLLVYVPVLLFVGYLLVRYWRYIPARRSAWLATVISIGYLLLVSSFGHWWAGLSYGPRFSTDLVPWFVLLAILGIKGMLNWRAANPAAAPAWNFQLAIGAVLLIASIFVNARGAVSLATWRWNPSAEDEFRKKLWDWRQPQFLAGLVAPPLEHGFKYLPVGQRIDFRQPDQSNPYVWYGWSKSEPDFRWTDGHEAALVFATDRGSDLTLRMQLLPFIREGVWPRQRVELKLNDKVIDSLTMTQNHDINVTVKLPGDLLRPQNVLKLRFPDAAAPELLKVNMDQRELAIAVYWIELQNAGDQPAASDSR